MACMGVAEELSYSFSSLPEPEEMDQTEPTWPSLWGRITGHLGHCLDPDTVPEETKTHLESK